MLIARPLTTVTSFRVPPCTSEPVSDPPLEPVHRETGCANVATFSLRGDRLYLAQRAVGTAAEYEYVVPAGLVRHHVNAG